MPSTSPAEPPSAPTPRHTNAAGRSRIWLWAAVGVVVVIAVALALVFIGDDNTADAPLTPAPSPTSSGAAPSPAPGETGEEAAPGEIVVTAGADGVELFAAAGDSEPVDALGQWTALGAPTTLLGFARESVDGDEWIQVGLPEAPNHRRAWVREADVSVSSTTTRIDIYLDEREFDLSVAGDVQVSNSVVIGAPESPTPLGVFWVTDPLDFTTNPSGVYGAFALGMNGWSETLDEFNGGPPQLAIHGTNQPELLGENVSNGCIRLPNDVVVEVAAAAAVGTPVVVHASR